MNAESTSQLRGKAILSSAPGRICLFGEHQDYLGLPIIAAAINLRIRLEALPRNDNLCHVSLPDIGEDRFFSLTQENPYRDNHDFLPAGINVLRRQGVTWPCGYDVTVRSTIPINSGASSSTALQVAWCAFLLAAAGDSRAADPRSIALVAHESEVIEFKAPGGVMDHFATALGGVIWLDTVAPYTTVALPPTIGDFVLVDSGIPKDTTGVLAAKRKALEGLNINFAQWKNEGYPPLDPSLWPHEEERRSLLEGTIANALITVRAKELLSQGINDERLGKLLSEHHANLSRFLGVSHPAIDALLKEAVDRGATGGKINGSGCGGSFFVHAPNNARALQQHFREKGLRAWIVRPGAGVLVQEFQMEAAK